jgi:hypothetical protein
MTRNAFTKSGAVGAQGAIAHAGIVHNDRAISLRVTGKPRSCPKQRRKVGGAGTRLYIFFRFSPKWDKS